MTASTPPLVDVIAEELAGHNYAFLTVPHNRPGTEITCAGCGISEGNPKLTKAEWFAAHQARAVLDALTKAGGVEWGIRYGDGDIDGGYLHKSEAEGDIARLRDKDRQGYDPANNEPITLLTRQRFEHTGPWTAVEGS